MSHQLAQEQFGRLLTIMDELRTQCPWDREQTLASLRTLSIEEVYELSEAILANDLPALRGELGDLLLHIVFYARIASEQNAFTMAEVIDKLCEKLIRRHPHIYGDTKVSGTSEVLANWESIKLQEGNKSVLSGVPNGLPALVKAYRMQEKAAGVGFDWPNSAEVLPKLEEELRELAEAPDAASREAEFGDILFTLINYGRHIGINAEDALEATNRKFRQRFQAMEAAATASGKSLKDLPLDEQEALWQQAKQ